jgi:hypothetical protein
LHEKNKNSVGVKLKKHNEIKSYLPSEFQEYFIPGKIREKRIELKKNKGLTRQSNARSILLNQRYSHMFVTPSIETLAKSPRGKLILNSIILKIQQEIYHFLYFTPLLSN